jgi:hypothetical protein
VDSVVKATDKNKKFYEGTKEGEIYEKDKIVGAYTTQPFFDKETNKLYRLKYIQDTDTNITTALYYLSNELIYATVKTKVKRGKKTITKAKYYFKDKDVVLMEGLNPKKEEALKLIDQADLAQRNFYETWFKDEKP